jgi:hypothetical protein
VVEGDTPLSAAILCFGMTLILLVLAAMMNDDGP